MQTLYMAAICGTLLGGVALPQSLNHRSPPIADATASTQADARKALPLAAEGEYRWGEPGEVIELYVEQGALRGYMTRRSDRRNAGSAPMTFSFVKASTDGARLSFATRQIHGGSYSFEGRVVRGPYASPSQDGHYLLVGMLKLHRERDPAHTDNESTSDESSARQVSLKLTAGSH